MKKILLLSFLLIFSVLLCSCSPRSDFSRTEVLMTTPVAITVIASDESKANLAIDNAFNEMHEVESLMNLYDNKTQLAMLNSAGVLLDPDPSLVFVIQRSLYYSVLTNGSFDVTVQPILDLFTNSFEVNKRPPTSAEINDSIKLIDFSSVIVTDSRISLEKKGMKITLGGITKGYAVDRAIKSLKDDGISDALVVAGGNMGMIGFNKEGKPWRVALKNPRDELDYITVFSLTNKSVSTSGDYERYFEPTKTFHHIVNPKTGYSATECMSVTIIADNGLDADALSTGVFVLGPVEGLKLVESIPGVEVLIITENRSIIRSNGLSKYELD